MTCYFASGDGFDVPVAPTDYGKPLHADFGEPGKAYAGFHQVLAGDSPEALRPLLDEGDGAELAENGPQMLDALREDHPTQGYRIVKGFANGDRALLLVEGETSVMKVETEVHLVREQGTWRTYDEILQSSSASSRGRPGERCPTQRDGVDARPTISQVPSAANFWR